MNATHTLKIQTRFNDVDMFGHINNAIYIQYFDLGKYEYFQSLSDVPFGSEPTAPVVANINVDFLAPAYITDELTVTTRIESIADSSMVMRQEITDAKGTVKCTARTVMVNIDLATGRPTTVSDPWRKKILG